MTSRQLVQAIAGILQEKKAHAIEILQIGKLSVLGEYFIIADTDNTTHVKSLVDEVELQTKKMGETPKRIERDKASRWIVLDYQDVIVHIFHREARQFYDLERLWADGERLDLETLLEE